MKSLFLILAINFSALAGFPENLEGSTYEFPGPNCFGVAMHATGHNQTVRGVDVLEFEAFISEACEEVEVPVKGDIGTFSSQGNFIHAFTYLGEDMVLEKTGVDYLGKTPILLREISHTIYTFEASPECRRYGNGSRDCYNDLTYYRCQKQADAQGEVGILESEIEAGFSFLLEGKGSPEPHLKAKISRFKELVKSLNLGLSSQGKAVSYSKQYIFIFGK